ncbi:hypothetical protein Dsin_022917 [Dipteronia sinensis]|uniref:Secreted protein n=1 Tax=Dipteronia sinensis TaxID=43782 RepID=A0AAE0A3A2_9ROSI|nr:hypothetical protein Dsin_022917 [Dipteronia sinensis]
MARLTSLAAILAAVLLLVANAYAVRTTISTAVMIEKVTNPNHREQSSCREEIPTPYVRSCRFYITRSPIRIAMTRSAVGKC